MSTTNATHETVSDAQSAFDEYVRAYCDPYEAVLEELFVAPENDLWFDDAAATADWFGEDVDRLLGAIA